MPTTIRNWRMEGLRRRNIKPCLCPFCSKVPRKRGSDGDHLHVKNLQSIFGEVIEENICQLQSHLLLTLKECEKACSKSSHLLALSLLNHQGRKTATLDHSSSIQSSIWQNRNCIARLPQLERAELQCFYLQLTALIPNLKTCWLIRYNSYSTGTPRLKARTPKLALPHKRWASSLTLQPHYNT